LRQNQHVANLLDVPDQLEFEQQLQEILRAVELGVEVQLAPQIKEGMRVRIKSGPLRGFEAWVQRRDGVSEVVLRLDFIGQAAAISSPADEVEPI
jgi:transcription antitermination factor NusG